jgi:hypothetical protein
MDSGVADLFSDGIHDGRFDEDTADECNSRDCLITFR